MQNMFSPKLQDKILIVVGVWKSFCWTRTKNNNSQLVKVQVSWINVNTSHSVYSLLTMKLSILFGMLGYELNWVSYCMVEHIEVARYERATQGFLRT